MEDDPSVLPGDAQLDMSLWPTPHESYGDGSEYGESEDNDGHPGAVGGERTLARAFAKHGWTADDQPIRLRVSTNTGVTATIPSPFYSGRGGARIRLGIFHTAEGARTVQALGSWFQRAGAKASSHTGIDDHDTGRFVPDVYSAWTARSANPASVQTELCAFAAWDAAEWARHPGMLERAAQWAVQVHRDHGIPLVRVSDAATKTGTGFCMHVDITRGWHDGTHTDCGNAFPIDTVLARARQIVGGQSTPGGFLMSLSDSQQTEVYNTIMAALGSKYDSRVPGSAATGTKGLFLSDAIMNTDANVFALAQALLASKYDSRVPGTAAVGAKGITFLDAVLNTDANAYQVHQIDNEVIGILHHQADQIAALTATVTALQGALGTVAAGQGADPAAVQAAAKAGAEEALSGYQLKLSRTVSAKRTGRIGADPAPEPETLDVAAPTATGNGLDEVVHPS